VSLLSGSRGIIVDTVTRLWTGQLRNHGLLLDKHKWCLFRGVHAGPGVCPASCSVGGRGHFPCQ